MIEWAQKAMFIVDQSFPHTCESTVSKFYIQDNARKENINDNKFCVLVWIQKQPPDVFYKKVVLKNFAIFTGKHLCWSFFWIELQTWRSLNFINKRLYHKCFPVNIAKILRTPILKNICERLLLNVFYVEIKHS